MLRFIAPALLLSAGLAFADDKTPAEIVGAGLQAAFVDFDAAALPAYFHEDYIQHNPGVPTGLAAVQGFLPKLKDMGLAADVHRFFADGDLVVVHSTYTNAQAFDSETMVAFDIFRVADGKIAEHWDNLMPVTPPNPSGRTLVDGPTEITDLKKTEANKALVRGFAERILKGGEFDALPEFISTEMYHQHNSQIADGLDGLAAGFASLAEAGVVIKYDTIHKVIGQGNFVLVMSEGALSGEPTAYYDLFRVADGKIVEHWDVIQEIPAKMAHQNGKF
ncbi:MAG: nuclear transport factor 2 family protein [Pseudomonadota bacterium]